MGVGIIEFSGKFDVAVLCKFFNEFFNLFSVKPRFRLIGQVDLSWFVVIDFFKKLRYFTITKPNGRVIDMKDFKRVIH